MRWAALAITCIALLGCGAKPKCGPESCTGCCNDSDSCIAIDAPQVSGTGI